MTTASPAPRNRAALRFCFLLIVVFAVLLLYMAMMPASPQAWADPPATSTPRPDCHLGYTISLNGNPPDEATMRPFRAGVVYQYAWPITSTPGYYAGAVQIQLVRVHNKMATPGAYYYGVPFLTPDNTGTPSWELFHQKDPDPTRWASVTPAAVQTTLANAIATVAGAHQGTLWLIGNEIDHPDMTWPWPSTTPGVAVNDNHQDAILPRSYAQAYKAMYDYIKGIDPSALIAPGSTELWTETREAWWNEVLAAYDDLYHEPMPVEWWNVHNYLRSERYWYPGCAAPTAAPGSTATPFGIRVPAPLCNGWSASYPPGWPTPGTPAPGETPTPVPTMLLMPLNPALPNDQYNAELFRSQLIRFRHWLKYNGYHDYQDTPVIVSEFGANQLMYEPTAEPYLFNEVMPWMLSATDPDLGYPYDGYHLVQQWVFFSAEPYGYDWSLLNANYTYSNLGLAWLDYVNDPASGYVGSPCGYDLTPQAWGPGVQGYSSDPGDGGGSQASSSGGVLLDETPTPNAYPAPDSTAYP